MMKSNKILLCAIALLAAGVDAARDRPYLPPLLELENGTRVESAAVWSSARRPEVQGLLEAHILGAWPEQLPRLSAATVVNTSTWSGAASTFFHLVFAVADENATEIAFDIEVLTPASLASNTDAKAPPLFLTQWNHREWALVGVARGYVSVRYPAADTRDVAPDFQRAHPKATMMLIMARALVAHSVLDFFFSDHPLAPNFNREQVCITGHSRNGKQSLMAAAFDTRITAVVGSSPGSPIASPYHMSSHNFYGEGPDAGQAGHWWLNSTAAFASHPYDLPMDGHGILASIAPRACAVANGWSDHEGDISFADEYAIVAAAKVYALYNATTKLHIMHRPGDHHGFVVVDQYFDYFDVHFDRLDGTRNGFALSWAGTGDQQHNLFSTNRFLTPAGFSWDAWNSLFGAQTPPPPSAATPLEERVRWVLGQPIPTALSAGSSYAEDRMGSRLSYPSVMMGYDFDTWKERIPIERQTVSFGDYVTGNMYWPKQQGPASTPLGCVVWLHPYSYATGYYGSYVVSSPVVALVQAGFAVLAYDQVGFASRLRSGGTNFYARYGGNASLFGRMVRDARAAIDFLLCLTKEGRASPARCGTGEAHGGAYPNFLTKIPNIDANKLVLAGYALGGNVALHAAALDERVKGVASFAGFTPMRTDTNDRSTLGLRRLYDLHALLPRLGLFREDPSKVPYDYDEIFKAINPRPALVFSPRQDRDATFVDVEACIKKSAWGGLNFTAPDAYTNMGSGEQGVLAEWVKRAFQLGGEQS